MKEVVYIGQCQYARAKQTDQTTTLCVQEVEIYLERWEVLGALVDVSVRKGEKVVKEEDAYAIFLN